MKQSTSPSAQVSLMSGSLCTCWKVLFPGRSPIQATGTKPEGRAASTAGADFPTCVSVEVLRHDSHTAVGCYFNLVTPGRADELQRHPKGAVLALGRDLQVFSRAAFAAGCRFLCTVWWMRAIPARAAVELLPHARSSVLLLPVLGQLAWPGLTLHQGWAGATFYSKVATMALVLLLFIITSPLWD